MSDRSCPAFSISSANSTRRVSRRRMLSCAGVSLALPFLQSLEPPHAGNKPSCEPRFVGIYHPNGVNPYKWYPETAGSAYTMPEHLAMLKDLREHLTVFTGLAHFRAPASSGHAGATNFLTAHGNGGGKPFGSNQSFDQYLAERIGQGTRYESLCLSWKSGIGVLGGRINTLSFDSNGSPIPAQASVSQLFEQLFVEPSIEAKQAFRQRHSRNQSILDTVNDQLRSINRRLDSRDKQKLDNYASSVRDVERSFVRQEAWLEEPWPKPPEGMAARVAEVRDHDHDLMVDLMMLALVSDSTRVMSFMMMGEPGLYHTASHWDRDRETLLPKLDEWNRKWIASLGRLARGLQQHDDGQSSLLDSTAIVFSSGHGRRPHYAHDLPVALLGGRNFGFKHGRHLAYAPIPDNQDGSSSDGRVRSVAKKQVRTPMANLFVSIANAMGVETERFVDSTGTLPGLC